MGFQSLSSCFEALEKFMLQPYPVGSPIVLAVKTNSVTNLDSRTPAMAVANILGIKCLGNCI